MTSRLCAFFKRFRVFSRTFPKQMFAPSWFCVIAHCVCVFDLRFFRPPNCHAPFSFGPLADGQIKCVGLIRRYRYTDLHNVKQKDPYQNDADRNTEQHYGDTQHCHCSLLVTLRPSMAARMSCILGGSIVRAWAKNLNFNQVCRSRP